jgi:hypothetical protein
VEVVFHKSEATNLANIDQKKLKLFFERIEPISRKK